MKNIILHLGCRFVQNVTTMTKIKEIGPWLKDRILESGQQLGDIHARLGVSRVTLYRWLGTPNLKFSIVKQIADSAGLDISEEFEEEFKKMPVIKSDAEIDSLYKEKYLQAMEKYSMVLEEREEYRTKIQELENEIQKLSGK